MRLCSGKKACQQRGSMQQPDTGTLSPDRSTRQLGSGLQALLFDTERQWWGGGEKANGEELLHVKHNIESSL